MNEYVTELLLKNAVCTVDEKLMELRSAYRESGVPT